DIPFLFMSAKSGSSDLKKGMDLGADDYLVKPFKANLLVNSLNSIFEKRSSTKGNILIIDAEPRFAASLSMLLQQNRYNCHVSLSDNSVEDLAKLNNADLILYNISQKNGHDYSGIKKLKEYNLSKNVPIIFLGSEENKESLRRSTNFEFSQSCINPFEFEEILRVIDLNLGTAKNSDEIKPMIVDNIRTTPSIAATQIKEHSNASFLENQITDKNRNVELKSEYFNSFQKNYQQNQENIPVKRVRDLSKDYEQYMQDGKIVVLVNLNRADYKESLNFQQYLLDIIQNNFNRILVDVSQTEYMDSAFIGALINISRKLKLQCAGELNMVINRNNNLTNPFLLEGLKKYINTFDNLNLALNCFGSTDNNYKSFN
ncbi:MAG: hypothetical protein K8H86_12275, partial [Ignavibacteriaceae bacterium]|nr:hypothetical protein [Ignavibacteriaceae bacterium]